MKDWFKPLQAIKLWRGSNGTKNSSVPGRTTPLPFSSAPEVIESKLQAVRRSAARRGYACTLTYENVALLLAEPLCAYTGEPFDDPADISFERVDNDIGYEPGNVIPVKVLANRLKSNFSLETLRLRAAHHHNRSAGRIQHAESVIRSWKDKIARREQAIAEQQKLLKKDLNSLKTAQANLVRTQLQAQCDHEEERIYKMIVATLEREEPLGDKYMTTKQRVVRKVVTFGYTWTPLTTLLRFVTKSGQS